MTHLWAPWRMDWVRGKGKRAPDEGCVLCDLGRGEDELVVARSREVYVMLNAWPYNNGHLMIVPCAHVDSQESLAPKALADLMETLNHALATLRALYQPPGFNWGANLGAAAGAGLPGHFHLHIVPRWPGDSSFMSTVGGTRVIPDSLENCARELREGWHAQRA